MPDVVLVGGLLTPTLRVPLLLSLMVAGLLVAGFAARPGLDRE